MTLWLLCAAPTWAQADAELLMVGNSYTSRNQLPGIVGELLAEVVPAWSSVDAAMVTQGGQTWTGHLASADGTLGDTALRQHLVTAPHPWQVVVLQEQSQIPGFPQDEGTWLASRDAGVALDDLVEGTSADTLLFVTWGRRQGDNQNPTLYPDFSTMQDALTAGYLAYAEAGSSAGRPVLAAPVGEAFRVVHDEAALGGEPAMPGTEFWVLYSDDGSHPSLAGSTLAAATMVAAWTGRAPSVLPSLTARGLDPAMQESLLAAAVAVTLDDPLGPWSWPWVHAFADWPAGEPISGDVQRPWVFVDAEVEAAEVVVGDGTLALLESGVLGVDQLVVEPGGALSWQAGELEAATVVGDLVVPDAGVLVVRDTTDVQGSVGGTGTVAWAGWVDAGDERVVLTTAGLDSSALRIDVGDLEWEVRGDDLWVLGDAVADSEPEPEGGGVPTSGTSAGCGCRSSGLQPGWLVPWSWLSRR